MEGNVGNLKPEVARGDKSLLLELARAVTVSWGLPNRSVAIDRRIQPLQDNGLAERKKGGINILIFLSSAEPFIGGTQREA